MSATYTYNIPLVYTPESNESYINMRVIKLKECNVPSPIEPISFANLWNYNLCSQDDKYCQPWLVGDKIYVQYKLPSNLINNIYPVLMNGDTDSPIWLAGDIGITFEVANDFQGNRYANIILDTTYIPANFCCFYLKYKLYSAPVDTPTFDACVANKIATLGYTNLQAIDACLGELVAPENISEIVTEPYCKETCGRNTMLITGSYPKYDCYGNYYGPFDGYTNSYRASYRVYGEIVQESFGFESTIQNNNKKSSKQVNNWLLRTPKIPPYVAYQMAICFNSKILTINGVEFKKASELEKNNEDGFMWIINTIVTTECSEINFTCN